MLHGAGIFTYMTGWFCSGKCWDSYSSTMVRIWVSHRNLPSESIRGLRLRGLRRNSLPHWLPPQLGKSCVDGGCVAWLW
jgi:hypothetical protein